MTDADILALMKKWNISCDTIEANKTYGTELLQYYLMGICGTSVCCFGVIANVLSLVVLTRKAMRSSSTYVYLAALSICDLLILLLTMLLISKDTRRPDGTEDWMNEQLVYYPYMFPYVHAIAVSFQVLSIWLTLAFTTDRYIMICHPFKAESMCTKSRARYVILGLFLCAFIIQIPRFFEYGIYQVQTCEKRTWYNITPLGWSGVYRKVYHLCFYLIFVCGLPFIVLAVMNSFLILAVHRSRKKGREINATEKKRNDTTVMLIGVIVTFFICQLPALISRVLWATHHDPHKPPGSVIPILNEVGNLLVMTNSAANIVPYYFFGRRFRREFWNTFCCCLCPADKIRRLSVTEKFHYDCKRTSDTSAYSRQISRKNSEKKTRISDFTNCTYGPEVTSLIATPSLGVKSEPVLTSLPPPDVKVNGCENALLTDNSSPTDQN